MVFMSAVRLEAYLILHIIKYTNYTFVYYNTKANFKVHNQMLLIYGWQRVIICGQSD